MTTEHTTSDPSGEQDRDHAREELEHHTPDGVGPDRSDAASIRLGVLILAISGIVAIFLVLWRFGGLAAAIVSAILIAVFGVIGAAPAWLAGVQRHHDEEEIDRQLSGGPGPDTHRGEADHR